MKCKYCGRHCGTETGECLALPVGEQNGQKWWVCKRCTKELARKSRPYRASLRKNSW